MSLSAKHICCAAEQTGFGAVLVGSVPELNCNGTQQICIASFQIGFAPEPSRFQPELMSLATGQIRNAPIHIGIVALPSGFDHILICFEPIPVCIAAEQTSIETKHICIAALHISFAVIQT